MRLPVSVAFSRVMVALVVAMSLPTLAWADTKIAVVDLQKVLKSTNAGKAAQKKFDDLRDKKKASLEAKGKSMEKRAARGQAQASPLLPRHILGMMRARIRRRGSRWPWRRPSRPPAAAPRRRRS